MSETIQTYEIEDDQGRKTVVVNCENGSVVTVNVNVSTTYNYNYPEWLDKAAMLDIIKTATGAA